MWFGKTANDGFDTACPTIYWQSIFGEMTKGKYSFYNYLHAALFYRIRAISCTGKEKNLLCIKVFETIVSLIILVEINL